MTMTIGNKNTYSFSRLSAFNQCRYEFFLNYMTGVYRCGKCGQVIIDNAVTTCPACGSTELVRVHKKNNAFAQYGSFVHELMEKTAKGELAEYELLSEYEEDYAVSVPLPFPPNSFVDLAESYYMDGYHFLENFDGVGDYDIVDVEKHFTVDFDSFCFQGFIDLLLKDRDGNFVVWDWKSKKKFASKAEQKKYARQLYLYSRYVYDTYGVFPKTLIFYHFRADKPTVMDFDRKAYDEALKWAADTVQAIENNTEWNEVQDDFYCTNLCNWRHICRNGEGED